VWENRLGSGSQEKKGEVTYPPHEGSSHHPSERTGCLRRHYSKGRREKAEKDKQQRREEGKSSGQLGEA